MSFAQSHLKESNVVDKGHAVLHCKEKMYATRCTECRQAVVTFNWLPTCSSVLWIHTETTWLFVLPDFIHPLTPSPRFSPRTPHCQLQPQHSSCLYIRSCVHVIAFQTGRCGLISQKLTCSDPLMYFTWSFPEKTLTYYSLPPPALPPVFSSIPQTQNQMALLVSPLLWLSTYSCWSSFIAHCVSLLLLTFDTSPQIFIASIFALPVHPYHSS